MSALRGFGITFDTASGRTRNWYVGRDGVERWTDNDAPVKPGPSIVCAGCGTVEVGIFDPLCPECRAIAQGGAK